MKQSDYIDHLFEVLDILENGCYWLSRSYKACKAIGKKDIYSDDDYDAFEALTSRFARVSDILIQQVYRSIDSIEFESGGTMIDLLNRAEKRGLINSIDEIREIRELRNSISHEYMQQNLIEIFHSTLEYTPRLFELITLSWEYCRRYGYDHIGVH